MLLNILQVYLKCTRSSAVIVYRVRKRHRVSQSHVVNIHQTRQIFVQYRALVIVSLFLYEYGKLRDETSAQCIVFRFRRGLNYFFLSSELLCGVGWLETGISKPIGSPETSCPRSAWPLKMRPIGSLETLCLRRTAWTLKMGPIDSPETPCLKRTAWPPKDGIYR
jgi:hypothetical protein